MNSVLDGLASNPALPAPLLSRLVQAGDGVLALSLAGRPDLSVDDVRALLARDDHSVVSVLLASSRVRPSDVPLDNPWVALAVTGHRDAPSAVARSLAVHPDHAIRVRLPESACSLPPDVVSLLAADDEWVIAELVMHHPVPPSLARSLSTHPSIEVRKAVAGSSSSPPDVLLRLSTEDTLATSLAMNPATPPAVVADLVRHPPAHHRLASRTDLPASTYDHLAANPGLWPELAANPALGSGLMHRLAAEGSRTVKRALARNPEVPLSLLPAVTAAAGPGLVPTVAAASEAELRALASSAAVLVASRPDLPADLFSSLLADPTAAEAVVTHPLLSLPQLRELVERSGPPLYVHAARNPLCTPELLHRMASGAEAEALRVIARHPRTSGETLLLCLEDAQARHLAAAHPHLPVEKIVELLGSDFTASPAASNPSLPVSVMEELLSSTT